MSRDTIEIFFLAIGATGALGGIGWFWISGVLKLKNDLITMQLKHDYLRRDHDELKKRFDDFEKEDNWSRSNVTK